MTQQSEAIALATAAELSGKTLGAADVVEAARDAKAYPALHEKIWNRDTEELAMERRLQIAHQILISITITTVTGVTTRSIIHTAAEPGYRSIQSVAKTFDLASIKLQQLIDDIRRAKSRLSAFRSMLDPDVADQLDDALSVAERAANAATKQPPTAQERSA